jgi:hypothetical protein
MGRTIVIDPMQAQDTTGIRDLIDSKQNIAIAKRFAVPAVEVALFCAGKQFLPICLKRECCE